LRPHGRQPVFTEQTTQKPRNPGLKSSTRAVPCIYKGP
jgi:hypothetical protein